MADNAASKRPGDAVDLNEEASPREKKMRASINDVAADLLCPITQELPFDPVMAKDGKIYERTAILEWFFKGHLTSPMTRRDLASDELTPNLFLKALIRDWLKDEHEKVMKVARMAPARALAAAAAEGRKRGRDE